MRALAVRRKLIHTQIAEAGELLVLGVAVYFLDVFGVLLYAIWRLAGRSLLEHSKLTTATLEMTSRRSDYEAQHRASEAT